MRTPRISEDFIPVSELKARAADVLRKVSGTGAPVVVTVNGRPAGVLLSPAAYDELTERARLVAAVEEGLADVEAGRVHSHGEVAKRMRDRFGSGGKPK
jgi:prevent-host-death family protein